LNFPFEEEKNIQGPIVGNIEGVRNMGESTLW
jgi:hypothetical protein